MTVEQLIGRLKEFPSTMRIEIEGGNIVDLVVYEKNAWGEYSPYLELEREC